MEHREQTEGELLGATRYKIVAGGKRKNMGRKIRENIGRKQREKIEEHMKGKK